MRGPRVDRANVRPNVAVESGQRSRLWNIARPLAYNLAMSPNCCHDCHDSDPQRGNPVYRRVLWSVLAINAVMFAVEIGAGLAVGSASLQADALDFLGDAGNYTISLFVVRMALRYRAMAALAKGSTMAVFGLWVFGWRCRRSHDQGVLRPW
jgi:hypothetical protein